MNYCYDAVASPEEDMLSDVFLKEIWQVDEGEEYHIKRNAAQPSTENRVAVRTRFGEGQLVTVQGARIALQESVLCVLPLQSIAEYKTASKRWSFLWLEFMGGKTDWSGCKSLFSDETEECLLNELIAAVSAEDTLSSQLGFRYLLGRWLSQKDECKMDIAEKAARFIHLFPLSQPFSLTEMSLQLGMSERTIRNHFIGKFAMSPKKYFLERRFKLTKVLLNTTQMPLKEIAEKAGFQNEYYFSSCFKARFGQAPSLYRKERGE